MKVVWLAWFLCGVCLLIALVSSAVTYHPDIKHLGQLLPSVFGGIGLLAGAAAVGLQSLPPTHGVHQSKPLLAALVAVAVTLTLLLALVA